MVADSGCMDGRHYLEVDPRITCDFSDPKWTEMFLISLLGIVLYVVGIPVHFFYKLFREHCPRGREAGRRAGRGGRVTIAHARAQATARTRSSPRA